MQLSQDDWIQLNEFILKVNALNKYLHLRESFLRELKNLISYDLGIFDLSRIKAGAFESYYDPVLVSKFSSKFDKSFIKDYDEKYGVHSYTKWINFEVNPIVYNETAIIAPEIRVVSEYFVNYLKPRGLVYCCGCNLVNEGITLGALTLYREEESGDFSEKDIFILKQIQPHLIKVLSDNMQESIIQTTEEKLYSQYDISRREFDIIKLVYIGYSNSQIADNLFISVNTVKKHLSNIFFKLEVHSRTQLNNLMNELGFE